MRHRITQCVYLLDGASNLFGDVMHVFEECELLREI